jgi:hypothetical protein
VSEAGPGSPELVVGAWRGYRVWRIAGDRLVGWWYTRYPWAPGRSEATCYATRWTLLGRRPRHPDLPVPQLDCKCGLYALHEPWDFTGDLPSRLFGTSDESNVVIGVVAGWGRAFRGERGWRAQFAKPVALYRVPHLGGRLDRVARRYGCQVVDRQQDLIVLADQHA